MKDSQKKNLIIEKQILEMKIDDPFIGIYQSPKHIKLCNLKRNSVMYPYV